MLTRNKAKKHQITICEYGIDVLNNKRRKRNTNKSINDTMATTSLILPRSILENGEKIKDNDDSTTFTNSTTLSILPCDKQAQEQDNEKNEENEEKKKDNDDFTNSTISLILPCSKEKQEQEQDNEKNEEKEDNAQEQKKDNDDSTTTSTISLISPCVSVVPLKFTGTLSQQVTQCVVVFVNTCKTLQQAILFFKALSPELFAAMEPSWKYLQNKMALKQQEKKQKEKEAKGEKGEMNEGQEAKEEKAMESVQPSNNVFVPIGFSYENIPFCSYNENPGKNVE